MIYPILCLIPVITLGIIQIYTRIRERRIRPWKVYGPDTRPVSAPTRIGSSDAIISLDRIEETFSHPNIYRRVEAVRKIEYLLERPTTNIAPLVTALDNPDPEVRRLAIQALCNRRNTFAVHQLVQREAGDKLLLLFHDPKRRVKRRAIRGVAAIGYKEAIPSLIEILESPERTIPEEAVEALEQLNTPEAMAAIREWRQRNDKS